MNLLVIAPNPEDGTCWYRAISPLSSIARRVSSFHYKVQPAATFADVLAADAVMLQRPVSEPHVKIMEWCKTLGRPLWCDWDDDYLDIPLSNPRVHVFGHPDTVQRVKTLAAGADLITVSSPTLAAKFMPFNPKRTAIVLNALDENTVLDRGPDRLPTRRVLWRGGDGHGDDLMHFGPKIIEAANAGYPALWTFLGSNPAWLYPSMPEGSVSAYPFNPLMDYFKLLGSLRPSIQIVPLQDTVFNRCKSDIALLEATWAGAAVLAPYWPDWFGVPGVTYYQDVSDFAEKLISLLALSDAELSDMNARARAYVAKNRTTTGPVFTLRAALIAELHKSGAPKEIDHGRSESPKGSERPDLQHAEEAARPLLEKEGAEGARTP